MISVFAFMAKSEPVPPRWEIIMATGFPRVRFRCTVWFGYSVRKKKRSLLGKLPTQLLTGILRLAKLRQGLAVFVVFVVVVVVVKFGQRLLKTHPHVSVYIFI